MAPYWIAALVIVAASAGLGFLTGLLRARRSMKTRPTAEAPWVEVLPAQSPQRRLGAAAFVFGTSGFPLLALSAKLSLAAPLNSCAWRSIAPY